MPRRKQELYEERRQQIIKGALHVFSTQGFLTATNKDIAEAAGIHSPGLIYHYFTNKEDLLRAVIESYAPPMQLVAHSEAFMALPPALALAQFGIAYLGLVDDPEIGACMRILIGEAVRSARFAETIGEIGPLRVWRLLANYLQHKMDEGLLQRVDPMIAARCFAGPFVLLMLIRRVFHLPEDPPIDTEALVATNVRIFLHGLKAE